MKNKLIVGSGSWIRSRMLEEAKIPFVIASHNSSECVDEGLSFEDTARAIAECKMNNIVIPDEVSNDQTIFLFTADTITQGPTGGITGKPKDRDDAIRTIRSLRGKSVKVGSAFCLEKRKRQTDGSWAVEAHIVKFAEANCLFDVPDHWMDRYLDETTALRAAGSVTVEDFGAMFLKSMNGSYSAVLGIPMLELREAMDELSFFE